MSREPALKLAISTVLPADLHVVSVRGREMLSQLSRVEVRVTSAPAGKDEFLPAALYKPARLTVLGSEHDSRSVLGMVTAVKLEGTTREGRPVHRIRIEPQLWRLRQRRTSRVFQDLSVVQIAEQLLTEHNVPRRLRLSRQYPTRAYTAQHHQTDYAFLRRLLAEEGIFFYFDHPLALGTDVDLTGMGDSEVLVLCDTAQYYPPLAGGDRLYYRPEQAESALAGDSDQISRFTLKASGRPHENLARSYDYLRPHTELSDRTAARFLAPPQMRGGHKLPPDAVYEHRQGTAQADPASAEIGLEQLRARALVGSGTSLCRRLAPGRTFVLCDHPSGPQSYVLTRIVFETHTPEQTDTGPIYTSRFECAPAEVPYRPPRPKPRRSHALETATVVGPPGEEIHTDELGRIKVQFHWDLDGEHNDHSSCWIRVAQPWAGAGWGAQFIPRVGMEVLVAFLTNDPDRPICTGVAYNATHPPPYPPTAKTCSGWVTCSSPGGEGYNELRFDDAKGQELVYVQAERNHGRLVKVDDADEVGRDQLLRVGRNRAADVGEMDAIVVGKEHRVVVKEPSETGSTMSDQHIAHSTGGATFGLSGGNASLAVKGDVAIDAGGNVVLGAGGDIQLKAAGQISITAAAAITITAAGPVSVKGTDVVIKGGTVKIN